MPKVYNIRHFKNQSIRMLPKTSVYIGRPSKWGNPYEIGKCYSLWLERKTVPFNREDVIKAYKEYINNMPELKEEAKVELKGKDLVCWCAPEACHGDILLEIANNLETQEEHDKRKLSKGLEI